MGTKRGFLVVSSTVPNHSRLFGITEVSQTRHSRYSNFTAVVVISRTVECTRDLEFKIYL